jgi:hypothetical protein
VQRERHRLVPVLVAAELFPEPRDQEQGIVGPGTEHQDRGDYELGPDQQQVTGLDLLGKGIDGQIRQSGGPVVPRVRHGDKGLG